MHAPFLRAAPAADVLRRRAELARAKARPKKEVDFSATAKSATFSFASPGWPKDFRRKNADAETRTRRRWRTRVGACSASPGRRRRHGGSQTRRGAPARRHGQQQPRRRRPLAGGVGVAALPGELLAFAEILCDAALEGTAVTLDDAEDALDDEEDETDAGEVRGRGRRFRPGRAALSVVVYHRK